MYAATIMPKDYPGVCLLVPIQVCGDRNCLFRSASVRSTKSEEHHLELHFRTTVELSLHADYDAACMAELANPVKSAGDGFSSSMMLQSTLSDAATAALLSPRRMDVV